VKTYSQELRFTSNKVNNFSWIAGAYFIHTERFISTDNIVDRGFGVPRVYETPIVDPTNPYATNTNFTFLADSQNNNAWAVFADATYEFTKQWEFDAAIRYDEDQRQNTTDTPTEFLPAATLGTAHTGEVRKETFSAVQPKGTLRYKPTENVTIYGGWSRGFHCSGGFNQSRCGVRSPRPPGTWACMTFSGGNRRHLGNRLQEASSLTGDWRRTWPPTPPRTMATSSTSTLPPRRRTSATSMRATRAGNSS
jgi:outer membrane receptor protein involved in Fe transport